VTEWEYATVEYDSTTRRWRATGEAVDEGTLLAALTRMGQLGWETAGGLGLTYDDDTMHFFFQRPLSG
jgi:hypothetical protein